MRFFEISHDPADDSWHLLCNGKIHRDLPSSPNGLAYVDLAAALQAAREDPESSILDHAGRPGLEACDRAMELLSDGGTRYEECEGVERLGLHALTEVYDVMLKSDRPISKSYATRLLNAMRTDGHVYYVARKSDPLKEPVWAIAALLSVDTRRGAATLAESQCTRHIGDDDVPGRHAVVIEAARRRVFEVLADGKYHRIRELMDAIASPHRGDEATRRQIQKMADRGEIRRRRGTGNGNGGHQGVAWFALLDVVDEEGYPKSAVMRTIEGLDELAVSPDAKKREALKMLRSNGFKVSDATLLDAQRFRRERAEYPSATLRSSRPNVDEFLRSDDDDARPPMTAEFDESSDFDDDDEPASGLAALVDAVTCAPVELDDEL